MHECHGQAEIFCVCMHMHVTAKHMGPVQNSSCMYHMGLPQFFFFLINLKFEKIQIY